MENIEKNIVLINSNYILKEIINNQNTVNVTELINKLSNKYGNCIHISNDIDICKEFIENPPSFLDKSENYTLPLSDYELIRNTILNDGICILHSFSIPQLQTFKFDFKDNLENLYVCNANLEKISIKSYLASIDYKTTPMKSVDTVSNKKFRIKLKNNQQVCYTTNDSVSVANGNFLDLNVIPEGNHDIVTLKILDKKSSAKYYIEAFEKLFELSYNSSLPKEIKELFPDFLVYSDNDCVGYGYNRTSNNNYKTLKEYLKIKIQSDNSSNTFKELLDIAKKFICTAKIFQTHDIYFHNLDLNDFKVILDNNGRVQNILPISCENLCINGVITNDIKDKISTMSCFSKRYDSYKYQSYFYDMSLLYIVLKIITLNVEKDTKFLNKVIKNLKFSSIKTVSDTFNKNAWRIFDELGNIFIEKDGHFSICNIIDILNSCKKDYSPIFSKITKKGLFNISVVLSLLCLILFIVILMLIL